MILCLQTYQKNEADMRRWNLKINYVSANEWMNERMNEMNWEVVEAWKYLFPSNDDVYLLDLWKWKKQFFEKLFLKLERIKKSF